MFKKLSPYRKALEEEIQSEGLPMQRPLFLHYDNDPVAYQISYQYLFGQDILVAPVIEPGVTKKSLYLPDDQWVHLFTQEEYTGPMWVEIEAPIGVPPVFYRKGSDFTHLFQHIGKLTESGLNTNEKTEL